MGSAKLRLANVCERAGLNRLLLRAQGRFLRPYIRALNYHDVRPAEAARFEAQLGFFAEHFEPVGLPELLAFLAGEWPHAKPGLILTFDDGLRSHGEVAAPLLERYGFPGWFAVPAEFPDLAPDLEAEAHAAFRDERQVGYDEGDFPDGRPLLSWSDLRRLRERHVICCHSHSHRRLAASLTDDERELEIAQAKRHLEAGLEQAVDAFVWVGGEEWSYSAEAAAAIRAAGFRVAFMTNNAPIRPGTDPFQLQRTNVEADHPEALWRLSISGAYDALYTPKRRRVNRLTSA
jgi:peptidoglycan/xylan/chitin deacetylase (PgdA/CDA1 family)